MITISKIDKAVSNILTPMWTMLEAGAFVVLLAVPIAMALAGMGVIR